ncbi:uncharacterized protein LOC134775359 [Penaeus indicus]|uniref:uncharacterized protein LOC134775359 n=1 Tax=Penaeus indicus TaxID=29960 RepID=UPI00300C47BE
MNDLNDSSLLTPRRRQAATEEHKTKRKYREENNHRLYLPVIASKDGRYVRKAIHSYSYKYKDFSLTVTGSGFRPSTSVLPAVSEDPGLHSTYNMMKLVVLALALAAASAGTIYTPSYPGLGLTYGASPLVHPGVPVVQPAPLTYTVGAAPALVNPAPYRVHTGVKTVVAAEPVEQHGYVVRY